jgi:hypothetical protein
MANNMPSDDDDVDMGDRFSIQNPVPHTQRVMFDVAELSIHRLSASDLVDSDDDLNVPVQLRRRLFDDDYPSAPPEQAPQATLTSVEESTTAVRPQIEALDPLLNPLSLLSEGADEVNATRVRRLDFRIRGSFSLHPVNYIFKLIQRYPHLLYFRICWDRLWHVPI